MIPKHAVQLIEAISNAEKEPDKWSKKFIKSILGLIQQDKRLSQKQGDKLQEIYRRLNQ